MRGFLIFSLLVFGFGLPACGGDDDPPVTPDASTGDGGTADGGDEDGGQACTTDAECDDSLFCNGEERCARGQCLAGVTPELGDGVDCTTDTCDEDGDVIVHTADDSACDSLDRTFCDGGQVMEDAGSCDPTTDCMTVTTLLDACDALPMCDLAGGAGLEHATSACVETGATASCVVTTNTCAADGPACAGAELTQYTPTCDDAAGCDMSSDVTACEAADSICGDVGGVVTHTTYAPVCADATSCDPTGTPNPSTCPAPIPGCSLGSLTTGTATCDPATGCGASTTTASCPTAAPSCNLVRPVRYTTYAPACADRTSCDADGTATATDCLAPPACVANVYTTYQATCDVAAGGCGTRVFAQTDCSAMNSNRCIRGDLSSTTCSCNTAATGGCSCSSSIRDCAAPICLNLTTVQTCTGCTGTSCSGCRSILCLRGTICRNGRCL